MRKLIVGLLAATLLLAGSVGQVSAKCLLRPNIGGTFEHRVGVNAGITSVSTTLYAPVDMVQPNAADSAAMVEINSNTGGLIRVGVYKGNDRNWHQYIRVTSSTGAALYYNRPLTTWAAVNNGVPITITRGSAGPGFPAWFINIDGGSTIQVNFIAEYWDSTSVTFKFYTTNQSNQYFGWNQTSLRYAWTAMRVNGSAFNPTSWSRNGFTPFGDESKIIGDAFYAWDTYCS